MHSGHGVLENLNGGPFLLIRYRCLVDVFLLVGRIGSLFLWRFQDFEAPLSYSTQTEIALLNPEHSAIRMEVDFLVFVE